MIYLELWIFLLFFNYKFNFPKSFFLLFFFPSKKKKFFFAKIKKNIVFLFLNLNKRHEKVP